MNKTHHISTSTRDTMANYLQSSTSGSDVNEADVVERSLTSTSENVQHDAEDASSNLCKECGTPEDKPCLTCVKCEQVSLHSKSLYIINYRSIIYSNINIKDISICYE